MTELFPRVPGTSRGYDPQQVDEFFEQARTSYEGAIGADEAAEGAGAVTEVTSTSVRLAAFDLVRRGYQPAAVDAALDRLEAAFVASVRADFIAEHGQGAWMGSVVERATTLYERLTRPAGERFAAPDHGRGYSSEAVDEILARLISYFDDGTPLKAAEIRSTTFPSAPQSRAYAEGPVDAFLDRAVDVLLAVE